MPVGLMWVYRLGTALGYGSHGNTTTYGSATLGYDIADRHRSTATATGTVDYARDANGAIVARGASGEATLRYSAGPAGVGVCRGALTGCGW